MTENKATTAKKGRLTGIGFGPIQAGLFLLEAQRSEAFESLTVAEVNADRVHALRSAGGVFRVNVAAKDGLATVEVGPVTILNPADPGDRERLIQKLSESDIITTAVPSTAYYDRGDQTSVAGLLARACRDDHRPVVYCAENHHLASGKLAAGVGSRMLANGYPPLDYKSACAYAWQNKADGWLEAFAGQYFEFADTVIGKMSSVVQLDTESRPTLFPICEGAREAFLVESFNDILLSYPAPFGFPGFTCKDDLRPFQAAKLYGHNAVHAVAAYVAWELGLESVAECRSVPGFMDFLRNVFIGESGQALCRKYEGHDPLFTEDGFRAWADDLLERMTNPNLSDPVERVARDPARKLGWSDRLVGTMRLCRDQDVPCLGIAFACGAALARLEAEEEVPSRHERLIKLWRADPAFSQDSRESEAVLSQIDEGYRAFEQWRSGDKRSRPGSPAAVC